MEFLMVRHESKLKCASVSLMHMSHSSDGDEHHTDLSKIPNKKLLCLENQGFQD